MPEGNQNSDYVLVIAKAAWQGNLSLPLRMQVAKLSQCVVEVEHDPTAPYLIKKSRNTTIGQTSELAEVFRVIESNLGRKLTPQPEPPQDLKDILMSVLESLQVCEEILPANCWQMVRGAFISVPRQIEAGLKSLEE